MNTQTIVTSVAGINEERASRRVRRLATDVVYVLADTSIAKQRKSVAYSAVASGVCGKSVQFTTTLVPSLNARDIVYIGTTSNTHVKLVMDTGGT